VTGSNCIEGNEMSRGVTRDEVFDW
jgi:hypothetical protein